MSEQQKISKNSKKKIWKL